MISKIGKKSQLNSEMILENMEEKWKDRENEWKEKTYWKCGRKLWNDMENMEEK